MSAIKHVFHTVQSFFLRFVFALACLLTWTCFFFDREIMDGIGNTMQKKAAELERMAEVLVTGEQLR